MRADPASLMCWLATVGAVAWLVVWVIRDGRANERQKRAALARRFCVKCGYNVHACGSDRCPECGTLIRKEPTNPQTNGEGGIG